MTQIKSLYKYFKDSAGVSTDSRSVRPRELFFALSGPNFDGNKYASDALSKGAMYAVIDDANFKVDERYLVVDDTLKALQNLATYYRDTLSAPIIGMTGSNGKTTTKELITSVLSTQYKVHSTPGNFNNHIGVPLTLLACPEDAEFIIVEMGANHQGEINKLSNICKPDFGLITNIGKAHLEGFGGIEGVKKGKSELYTYLSTTNKMIFIDESNQVLVDLLPTSSNLIPYNSETITKNYSSEEGLLTFEYKDYKIKTHLTGSYNLKNVSCAIAVAEHFNLEMDNIAKGISQYIPVNNRSEIRVVDNTTIYLDAYNANPTSMELSVSNFISQHPIEQSLLILGDMLELGEYSLEEHAAVVRKVGESKYPAILVGKEFLRTKSDQYKTIEFVESLSEFDSVNPIYSNRYKFILLKGSRGIGLEKLLIKD